MGKILNWSTEEKSEAELKELMRTKNMRDTNKIARGEMVDNNEDDMIQKEMESSDGWEDKKVGDSDPKGFDKEDQEIQDEKNEKQSLKEARKLKRDMKNRLKELNGSDDKSFEFDDVLVTMRDGIPKKFHLSLSITQLAELYISGRIVYKSSEQRGLKHTKSKGDMPLINIKHTKEILNALMSSSSVNGGCIYLNYSKNNEDELIYDYDSNTLSGNSPLSVLDGAHRLEAMVMMYHLFTKSKDPSAMKNPNDFFFPVTIENATDMESKNIFVELNSYSLPISKTRIAFHDVYNLDNVIALKVMNESSLRNKIEVISNSIRKSSSCVMTFSSLSKGCSLFSPMTKGDAEKIAIYLCDFWDSIVELFPKIYGNVTPEIKQEEKTKTFVGEVMFINALFSLAVNLRDVEDWKSKLIKLTQENFLSKNNTTWDFCLREGNKLINSSKVQKTISEIFIKKVIG